MNNFTYITPEEYHKDKNDTRNLSLDQLKELANQPARKCCVCGVEDVWKLVDLDMCFSCTTGESDASDDYELIGGNQ